MVSRSGGARERGFALAGLRESLASLASLEPLEPLEPLASLASPEPTSARFPFPATASYS